MPDEEDAEVTNPGFRIPSAASVVPPVVGTVPPPLRIDLNHDGVDDLQQLRDGLLKAQPILETLLRVILIFAKPDTKVGQYVGGYFTQGKPALEAIAKALQ